ncbi:glycosyltransferase family 4 protein [Vibrio sp. CAU 1672]|uniref:glycosyltransferase family 4 protein n=1 Tax=Vibrio sp. CAU 1672 TaxID=3032594 RepID=UPI0023DA8048|nr:glycosyltransferase family 4 protein [Vibrio sp. CAU 1672]MDF2152157.1 glycosyltransferase family 4 protein [Vibrio sp. CAU 1672]
MKRVLMFDLIAMHGGSKVANAELLKLCDEQEIIGYIASTDVEHWHALLASHPRIQLLPVKRSPFRRESGIGYWLMCCFYAVQLLFVYAKLPKIDWLMGLSCPGNDMPLYLLRMLVRIPVVQMIHGPVAAARSTGYCLVKASAIYYLANTRPSMISALQAYLSMPKPAAERYWTTLNTSTFVNGISDQRWPTPANPISGRIFWAASLLKWKNLDLLLEAIQLDTDKHFHSDICYIRPKHNSLEVSEPDKQIPGVKWFETPSNLDQLRSRCGVFVSTSVNEPFGLSILEALAAGMCVVIPHDNSYWDRVLTHGKNCFKYTPNSAQSLHNAICLLNEQPWLKVTMGLEALNLAQFYRAARCYQPIVQYLQQTTPVQSCSTTAKQKTRGLNHV